MLESYEVGQKLTAEDFVSDLFFPPAKWDYAEITAINDNSVELRYVDVDGEVEETSTWSKEEMAQMFGWNIEEDENAFEIVDERDDTIESLVTEEIVAMIHKATTADIHGSYELLDAPMPIYIKVEAGKIKEAHIFSSDIACFKSYLQKKD